MFLSSPAWDKDNHLLLIDLRSKGINGSKAEAVCEQASIVLNKRLDIFFGRNKSMVISNYSGRHVYLEMTRRPCFPISNLWNFWMQWGWEDLRRWEICALGLSFAPCWIMFVSRPSHPSQFAGNASTMEWEVGWAHRYPHIFPYSVSIV